MAVGDPGEPPRGNACENPHADRPAGPACHRNGRRAQPAADRRFHRRRRGRPRGRQPVAGRRLEERPRVRSGAATARTSSGGRSHAAANGGCLRRVQLRHGDDPGLFCRVDSQCHAVRAAGDRAQGHVVRAASGRAPAARLSAQCHLRPGDGFRLPATGHARRLCPLWLGRSVHQRRFPNDDDRRRRRLRPQLPRRVGNSHPRLQQPGRRIGRTRRLRRGAVQGRAHHVPRDPLLGTAAHPHRRVGDGPTPRRHLRHLPGDGSRDGLSLPGDRPLPETRGRAPPPGRLDGDVQGADGIRHARCGDLSRRRIAGKVRHLRARVLAGLGSRLLADRPNVRGGGIRRQGAGPGSSAGQSPWRATSSPFISSFRSTNSNGIDCRWRGSRTNWPRETSSSSISRPTGERPARRQSGSL